MEDIQEDLEDIQRSLKEIEEWTSDFNQPFETDFYTLQDKGNSGQGKPEDSFVDLKQAFAPIWSYIVKFVAATIGSEDEDAEHIRRTLMGFFKIVMSYFQVTASFLKNFAVDWGERLDAFLNKLSILNLDLYKLPGVNCMVMLQNPTRSFQVAFYIFMVPFCLLGLALPRLLCAVAEPWMLTVWERSRKTQKGVPDLITEYQMNLTGINQADARRLQIAKDEARKIRERRTIVSFHRATPFVRFFVIVWAVYLVFGLFVCCELVVQSSLNAVQELDTLAKLAVGTFCQSSLERLGARTASKCDISGDKDKETCLFCGYGEYRTSTDDCLCCPCGSELDVINADCTGACRKLGEYGNASIEWPLYKAIAEKKCFPKAGTECLIIEIMGRYQFVPRNSQDRDIEYDVGCRDSKQGLVVITVENSQSSNHGDLNKELQFKDPFKGLKQQPGSEINPDMSCPHSQARQEYRSYTDARSWQQAENICIEWGGHLASFESFGDMNSSVSLMWQSAIDATSIQTSTRDKPAHPIENSHGTQKNIHKEAWIGLHRNSSVVTDPWKWIDGKNCTYAASNWWGFSPGWSLASEAWCNSDDQSRFVLSPPQPRPIPGHDCVHITWNGPASTCAQEKGSNVSSNTTYSGWTNGPCNATKSFVCSKQLASRDNFGSYCDNVKPPTSWPPASLDQMLGNGTYYWKSMCEITGGNGFGALTGEGYQPYSMCYEPWENYTEAFQLVRRRASVSEVSETVTVSSQQASVFIIIVYIGAISQGVILVSWLLYRTKIHHISRLDRIVTYILAPVCFTLCVHGALSTLPSPIERLKDRAQWTPGLIILPVAVLMHVSLGFFMQPTENDPCPWVHGIEYLALETIYLTQAAVCTATIFGISWHSKAAVRLLIVMGSIVGLSICCIFNGIWKAFASRQLAKGFGILGFFVMAGVLGFLGYLFHGHTEQQAAAHVLLVVVSILAIVSYRCIIRCWKLQAEEEGQLKFYTDLEHCTLREFTRKELHEELTKHLTEYIKKLGFKDELDQVDLDAVLETTGSTPAVIAVGKGNKCYDDWIQNAGSLYHLLLDERRISVFHMKERVTKVWLFSWTAFLFTIYPALSAVAISGFDCEDFGPDGWRLRDHPEALCPYRYAFGTVLYYENVAGKPVQNASQIKDSSLFETSSDSPEWLFILSCIAVLGFAIGIPVYMYLLLVLNGVPQIANRKQSQAAFQAFARHWRAKKVPKGIDCLAAFLVPEQETNGTLVMSVSKDVLKYMDYHNHSNGTETVSHLFFEKFKETLACEQFLNVEANSIDVRTTQEGLLYLTVAVNNINITDDLRHAGKLSIAKINEQVKRMLNEQKSNEPSDAFLPDPAEFNVSSCDETFHKLVDVLYEQLAKTDAKRQELHMKARRRRDCAKNANRAKNAHRAKNADCAKNRANNTSIAKNTDSVSSASTLEWTVFDEEMFWIRETYDAACKHEFCEDGIVDKKVLKNYVTVVDLYSFIRQKELGPHWNRTHKLVPMKGQESEFVKKNWESQSALKKSYVALLKDLKHFDINGGGDNSNVNDMTETDTHAQTRRNSDGDRDKDIEMSHCNLQRRQQLQDARTDQMELDKEEFTEMCKEIGISTTFIQSTDDLGNLHSYQFKKLYDFVKGEEFEMEVTFKLTFRISTSEKQLNSKEMKDKSKENDFARALARKMVCEVATSLMKKSVGFTKEENDCDRVHASVTVDGAKAPGTDL